MNDRELLELAAKAAGIAMPTERDRLTGRTVEKVRNGFFKWTWNPLADDGDAHRLAAKLELDVMHRVVSGRRIEVLAAGGPLIKHFYEGDTAEAMRRAIVLAAAEIGRAAKAASPDTNGGAACD